MKNDIDIERSHRQRTPTKSRGGKPRFLLHVNPDNVDEGDRIERENEKGGVGDVDFVSGYDYVFT